MIIDSFMFCDELDLLEIRLGQLDEVVDYFVFNELNRTHSGRPKPLHYQAHKSQFSKWHHKIVCDAPDLPPMGAWATETAQRHALENLVRKLNPAATDVLLTSDCDEIPNPETIKGYTPNLGLRNLKQYTFWYNFGHMFNYGSRWASRARIGTIQNMYEAGGLGPFHGGPTDDMDPNFPSLENAGWHCSYFSEDLLRIRRKVNSFAHEDLQHIVNSYTDKHLATLMFEGKDLYARTDIPAAQTWSKEDYRLPPYFLQNQERFRGYTNEGFYERHKDLLNGADTGQITPLDFQVIKRHYRPGTS